MKKEMYVKPSISVYEIEAEAILAGSETPVRTIIEDEDGSETSGLEYGGTTQQGGTYHPW